MVKDLLRKQWAGNKGGELKKGGDSNKGVIENWEGDPDFFGKAQVPNCKKHKKKNGYERQMKQLKTMIVKGRLRVW